MARIAVAVLLRQRSELADASRCKNSVRWAGRNGGPIRFGYAHTEPENLWWSCCSARLSNLRRRLPHADALRIVPASVRKGSSQAW